jgi:hypothetical protein
MGKLHLLHRSKEPDIRPQGLVSTGDAQALTWGSQTAIKPGLQPFVNCVLARMADQDDLEASARPCDADAFMQGA